VQAHATLDAARAGLVEAWQAVRQASPTASQIMLAHRRVDVRALNEQARAVRQEAGELGVDHVLPTGRGERAFAEGDRVYFLKNERSLGVKNGTLGTVERIKGEGIGASLVVRLDGARGAGTGRSVAFDVKDYAEIDHGYAATVHKSQGVTVDRTHVLATPGMDRHAAYVGLSRHRDGVSLHWSRDAMGSRDGLDARLGRERLKDTSLDYAVAGRTEGDLGIRPDSVGAYAARRGLVPESEIIFRERRAEVSHQAEVPAPRRSKFTGLKLNAAPMTPVRERLAEQASRRAPPESALSRAVGQFAEAVEDARRLLRAELPVLPHQQAAMDAGIAAIVAAGRGVDRADVLDTFNGRPALVVPAVEGRPGRDAAIVAIEAARDQRLALEAQAREAVRQWAVLERQYDRAGKAYEWDAQRKVGSQLVAFAKELKRDAQLESLMRERGRAFGIADGSRLDRVVRVQDLDRALRREIDIDHGLRRGGPSLGMGM
jgi:hypothetical protein